MFVIMNVPSSAISAVGICSNPVLQSANCAWAGLAPSKEIARARRVVRSMLLCLFNDPFSRFFALLKMTGAGRFAGQAGSALEIDIKCSIFAVFTDGPLRKGNSHRAFSSTGECSTLLSNGISLTNKDTYARRSFAESLLFRRGMKEKW